MKNIILVLTVLSVSFLVSGCGDSRADTVVPGPAPQAAATYKAGHGLKLTPVSRTFVNLTTAEVAVQDFPETKGAPAIPADALLRTVKGDFVYVANGEWFLRTPVKIGATSAMHIEIKDGLYQGDTIVVKGLRALALAELQALNGGVGCADGH